MRYQLLQAIVVSAILLLGSEGISHRPPYCDLTVIPTSYEGNLGVVWDNKLAVGPEGGSALINFQNNSSLPVNEITLLIEYADASRHPLFTHIFHARTRREAEPPFPFNRLSDITQLLEPLKPGDHLRISGSSSYTSTTCASYASVVLVRLTYSDETSRTWSSPRWQLRPELSDGPQYFDLPSSIVSDVEEFLLNARIGSDGKLKSLSPVSTVNADVLSKLQAGFAKWSFEPALDTGKEPSAEVLLLVRVTNPEPSIDSPEPANGRLIPIDPFVQIQLRLIDGSDRQWRLFFGHYPVPFNLGPD